MITKVEFNGTCFVVIYINIKYDKKKKKNYKTLRYFYGTNIKSALIFSFSKTIHIKWYTLGNRQNIKSSYETVNQFE